MTPTFAVVKALRGRPWMDRRELRIATRLDHETLTAALVKLTDEERIHGFRDCTVKASGRFVWNLTA